MTIRNPLAAVLVVSGTLLTSACPSTRQAGRDAVDMNCNPLALFSAYMMGQCLTGAVMMGVTAPEDPRDATSESRTRPDAGDPAAEDLGGN